MLKYIFLILNNEIGNHMPAMTNKFEFKEACSSTEIEGQNLGIFNDCSIMKSQLKVPPPQASFFMNNLSFRHSKMMPLNSS